MALPNQSDNETNFANGTKGLYFNIIKLLHSLIASIRNNTAFFIICLALGIAPLVIKNMTDANAYKASFTIAYDELFRKIYGDRLGKLNALVQRKEYKKVAMLLNVNSNTAKALKKVEGKNILGEDLSKDLNTDQIPFVVEIIVQDSSSIMRLQEGIVGFLETGNAFMADRKRIKKMENAEELAYLNSQMTLIDSLNKKGKSVLSNTLNTGTENKSAGSLFEFSYELYKRKQELLRKERMPYGLIVVDDAIVSVEAKRSLPVVLIIGTALGFFLYILLVGFLIPAFKFKEQA